MAGINRRSALSMVGVGAAVAALDGAGPSAAPAQPPAPAPRRTHQPRPLPFNAARLDGLSERLITSHWQNNYVGSVNALNMVETRLAAAMADPDFSPLIYGDIKREQLHRTGSGLLHQLSFRHLRGDRPAGGRAPRARRRPARARGGVRLVRRVGSRVPPNRGRARRRLGLVRAGAQRPY